MSQRVCSQPGCPAITDKPKCLAHRREAEQARGSAAARGYGRDHKALRARWTPLVATGNVKCWRCSEYIPADATWDLGHKDDRSGYAGPECTRCNRATASRR